MLKTRRLKLKLAGASLGLGLSLTGALAAPPPPPSTSPAEAAAAKLPDPKGSYKTDSDGYIRDWLMLGPIFWNPLWPAGELEIDRSQLPGEGNLKPRAGDKTKLGADERAWTAHTAKDAVVDLAAATAATDTKFVLGYAVTYVVSDTAIKGAKLRIGSNDMAKVYWNGKPVIRRTNTTSDVRKDAVGSLVDLKAGVNVLVMKIINDENKWGLAARLVGDGGKPIAVKISRSADGKGDLVAPDADGFIRDWLVLGPTSYKPRPYALGQLAKKFVANEEKSAPKPGDTTWVDGQPLKWTPWSAMKTGVLDFNAYMLNQKKLVPPARWEPNDTVFNPMGYAVTYVNVAEDMKDVRVKMGANDQGLVYVNGKQAAVLDEPGGLVKDKAEGKVSLKKGSNVVLLKVINAGDNWQGSVRFTDKDGKALTNLDIRLQPAPTPAETALLD